MAAERILPLPPQNGTLEPLRQLREGQVTKLITKGIFLARQATGDPTALSIDDAVPTEEGLEVDIAWEDFLNPVPTFSPQTPVRILADQQA